MRRKSNKKPDPWREKSNDPHLCHVVLSSGSECPKFEDEKERECTTFYSRHHYDQQLEKLKLGFNGTKSK
ncbi:hypothetical protein AXX17_AT3G42380 [Arabidopsis thaliana]|uniref:Uncharacterized protein n=1 Tax=Arabidopsis thaliana TaxID=3702 RepID=A0A178VEZ2_ARATH|nr:hypothetical protein AXX17_AT3G42380 [Arabidopsis thaliana]